MAGFNYAKSAQTAARLIKRFGQTGAIRRKTRTGGTDWNPETQDIDYPCTLVVTEYSLKERESSLIGTSDKKVLISTEGVSIPAYADAPASGNAPTERDQIVIKGRAHEVVRVDPLEPGGTVVLWTCQVAF
ncbi:hypothetical protein [Filomicrobium sp.]|uniref:hypothetical protein n=1 Tax=Filomicrobium sp. TaxID=2024831 RepID=UPI00258D759B|nr:hypothetical protein [Filomicrobium sp.]MCV0371666.1 hypothetical protein [Filomicrobium sp.]